MPHLTLEYSSNITEPPDHRALFAELHQMLARFGGIRIENCKSRSRPAPVYHVGSANGDEAFVHLAIRLLEGRSSEIRRGLGRHGLRILSEYFRLSADTLELQITVEIQEMDRNAYFKA